MSIYTGVREMAEEKQVYSVSKSDQIESTSVK